MSLSGPPWERAFGESHQAFEAFAVYRDLGVTRSQVKVAAQLGKSDQLMSRWSALYNWVDRAQSWDDELDRVKREAYATEVAEMGKRHAQQVQGYLASLFTPTQAFLQRLRDNPGTDLGALQRMGTADLLDLVQTSARSVPSLIQAERLARGLSTDNIEAHVSSKSGSPSLWGESGDEPDRIEKVVNVLGGLGLIAERGGESQPTNGTHPEVDPLDTAPPD